MIIPALIRAGIYPMILIPAYLVAIVTFLTGVAWIVFARSQFGRFQAHVLPWLGLPFFFVAAFYLWITFEPIDIAIRAVYARYSIISIAAPQAIILFLISLKTRGTHGRD